MDEQQQADGTSPLEAVPWRDNGTVGVAAGNHARGADEAWSSAGAALEPPAEPLALLTAPRNPSDASVPAPRRYAPGLDDDTPVGGMSAVEPPLWREAARHTPQLSPDYSGPDYSGPDYGSPDYGSPDYGSPDYSGPDQGSPDYRSQDYQDQETRAGQEYGSHRYPGPEYAGQDGAGPAYGTQEYGSTGYGAQLAASVPARAPAAPPVAEPEPEPAGLPQRVPSEPDVPEVPGPVAGARERWAAHELAWIADQLRRVDVPQEPTEWLDVDAVLDAVRRVSGVRDASVRSEPSGAHTLRLDLADDADPGQVSRVVARMLEERMGLSAAPQLLPQGVPTAAVGPAPEARAGQAERAAPAEPAVSAPPAPISPPVPVSPPPVSSPPVSSPPVGPPPPPPLLMPPPPPPAAPAPPPAAPPPPPAAPVPAEPATSAEPATPVEPATLAESSSRTAAAPAPERATPVTEPTADQPEVVSRPLISPQPGPRVVIDEVRVSTLGLDAVVEVRLTAGAGRSRGLATGPAVDSYVMRLAAVATARAIDGLLRHTEQPVPDPGTEPSRCFVEHTGLVPFGSTEVAVVVLLLVCGGWVEQLTGSALVDDDPRQAMVRATLGAVNRRLEALLG